MIYLPDRRWLVGAAFLALLFPVAFAWREAAGLVLALDLLWVLALIVDGWRLAAFAPEALGARRTPPPAFSVGRPLPVYYQWTNPLDRPLELRVREAFPEVVAPDRPERTVHLPARDTLREEVRLTPRRRGRAEGGRLSIRIRGAWGLCWRQVRLARPWQVLVYPSLLGASLRSLPTQAQRRREAGFRNIRRIGEGRVFESLKEWVPGEDTRTIDWKATARRGKVMARQYEDERRQQVLIVVDAGRQLTAEVDGRSRLDAVVEAALHLAHSAVEHDDNVGLLVFADTIQQWIPPARGKRALRQVLDALATVEGRLVEPDYPAAFAYLATHNRKRALTVLFTDVIDRTASEALVGQVGTLRPRHVPLAVVLREPALDRLAVARPATTAVAFERAAAEELLLSRAAALADMRARGILVLDVPPAGASTAVVDQYNRLKRRGVL